MELVNKIKKDREKLGLGVTWVSQDSTEDYKFSTHDNGGLSFLFKFNDGKIIVTKYEESKEILNITDFEGFWIGKSVDYCDAKYDPEYYGSAILIKINKFDYIYVGDIILKFNDKEEIIDFVANVGPSDVIYSYAVTQSSVYFFAGGNDFGSKEKCYLWKLPISKINIKMDPYVSFYNFNFNKLRLFCTELIHDRVVKLFGF